MKKPSLFFLLCLALLVPEFAFSQATGSSFGLIVEKAGTRYCLDHRGIRQEVVEIKFQIAPIALHNSCIFVWARLDKAGGMGKLNTALTALSENRFVDATYTLVGQERNPCGDATNPVYCRVLDLTVTVGSIP